MVYDDLIEISYHLSIVCQTLTNASLENVTYDLDCTRHFLEKSLDFKIIVNIKKNIH